VRPIKADGLPNDFGGDLRKAGFSHELMVGREVYKEGTA
jgi:hypothetical protein